MTRFSARLLAASLLGASLFASPAIADRSHTSERGTYGHWPDDRTGRLAGGRYDAGSLIAWEHPFFNGRAIELTGPVRSLSRQRIGLNDLISSIAVRGGAWEVCSDPDFRGRCRIIHGEEEKLSWIRMDDTITSLRPVRRHATRHRGYDDYARNDTRRRDNRHGRYRGHDARNHDARNYGAITLYTDPYFRGRAYTLDGADTYLKYRAANDTVSSIRVDHGVWEVCTDPQFRGRCEIVDASVGKLSPFGLDDNISSVRPLGRGKHARRPGWRG